MSVPAHPRTTGTVVRTFSRVKMESFLDKIYGLRSGFGVRGER